MSEYFLGLIAFSFFGAVVFSLVPEGNSKRYVRLLCGLCSIGCIAFPIFNLFSDRDVELYEISALFEASTKIEENVAEIYNSSLNEAAIENAEEILKNDIIQGTLAKYDDLDVKIFIEKNGDDFYIDRVSVFIYPSGYSIDPDKIINICKNSLGKECNIIYK